MAFLKEQRDLPSLRLCGADLPWVNKLKHLGNSISSTLDGNQMDMRIKMARYVDKQNTICQEFYFAHPSSKLIINSIYNGHYTGSQLWKLQSREYDKVISTYNRSIKIMLDLPWATHRCLIEPLTGTPHLSKVLVKRYLSFIEKIEKSEKRSLKQLLRLSRSDVRTVTGYNLRTIMLLAGKTKIDDLDHNTTIDYHPVDEKDMWKVDFIRELIEVKTGGLEVQGIETEEIQHILEYICTS